MVRFTKNGSASNYKVIQFLSDYNWFFSMDLIFEKLNFVNFKIFIQLDLSNSSGCTEKLFNPCDNTKEFILSLLEYVFFPFNPRILTIDHTNERGKWLILDHIYMDIVPLITWSNRMSMRNTEYTVLIWSNRCSSCMINPIFSWSYNHKHSCVHIALLIM